MGKQDDLGLSGEVSQGAQGGPSTVVVELGQDVIDDEWRIPTVGPCLRWSSQAHPNVHNLCRSKSKHLSAA